MAHQLRWLLAGAGALVAQALAVTLVQIARQEWRRWLLDSTWR